MIDSEIKAIKKAMKDFNITSDRIKSINIYWEKKFKDKAFPKIKIKLYKANDTNINGFKS